jgi:hypothetical protein
MSKSPHNPTHKRATVALVERGGRARSVHVPDLTTNAVRNVLTRTCSASQAS